jgi:hypothetical protein
MKGQWAVHLFPSVQPLVTFQELGTVKSFKLNWYHWSTLNTQERFNFGIISINPHYMKLKLIFIDFLTKIWKSSSSSTHILYIFGYLELYVILLSTARSVVGYRNPDVNKGKCWSTDVHNTATVFWVVMPCSLVDVYWRFSRSYCHHHQGDDDKIPEYCHLHTRHSENIKSH